MAAKKKSQTKTIEQEPDYRQFFRTSKSALFITSRKGDWIDFNDATIELFGFLSRDDFAAVKISGLYKKPSERKNHLGRVEKEDSVKDIPVDLARKDGSVFPALISITAIRDEQGTVTSFMESVRDATTRDESSTNTQGRSKGPDTARENQTGKEGKLRGSVDQLTESEKKFRSLFETMSEGVALHEVIYSKKGVATDYRIIEVNPAFESNTGIPSEQVRGKNASRVYGTGTPPYLDIYARVAASGTPESFDVFFTPLGRHFHIAVFSPKQGWFATVFSDISERKRLEEEQKTVHLELEEHHSLFSGIINSAVSDILSLDREYRYTSFNQSHATSMKDLYGTEIETGKSFLESITVKEDRKNIKPLLDQALQGDTVVDEGYRGNNALNRQYRDSSFCPIRNPGGEITGIAIISQDATERKKAEKTLRASEERYRRLTENSQDIIFRLSLPNREFEYVSPAAFFLTGYSPEEFLNNAHLMQDIIHPDFSERLKKQWERIPKGEVPREYEYQIIHKNGEPRWLHQRNTLVRDNTGHIVALEGFVTDITDRKTAEIALQQIEERYRLISENTGDIIWLLNLESLKFRFISPSVHRLLGYTAEEIMEGPLQQILTPESFSHIQSLIPDAIAAITSGDESARIRTVQIENVRKDGSVVPVEVVATLIGESKAGGLEIIGVSRDITERKRADDALKESEEKFRSLVETTSDLVWEIDTAGVITYISPKIREMLGYEPEEMIGRTPFEIMPPGEAESMTAEFNRMADSPLLVSTLVCRCLRKDGSVVVLEISAVPRFAKDGSFAGYRGIDRNITERMLIQDALKESEERYRTFVESANEAIFVIQDGLIPFCNKKGLEMIGHDAGYLATHSFLDLIHPDDRSAAIDRHVRRLKGEVFDPLAEIRAFDAQGVMHWLEINAVIVPWDGKPATLNFATDITERKNADNALRESETSYHGLFNTVKEAIFILDTGGTFLNVNDGATAMYGYPREFFIGKTLSAISAEGNNDLNAAADHVKQAFHDEPQIFEFWGRRCNGEVFPINVRLYHGSYFGKDVIIAVATDITERKRAEATLRESEHHYHLLADNVSDVIWTAGKEMNLTYISPSITALTGYTPEEFMNLRVEDTLTQDSKNILLQSRGEVLANITSGQFDACRPQILELEYLRKDGSTVWAEVVISLIRSSTGQPQGVIGVTRDITERKQTEEALKNSEVYLQTIINSVQTGLVIIDPKTHTIIDVNPTAEKLTGVSRDTMIGSVCHKYICPADDGKCPVTDLGQIVDNSERTLITANGPRSILKTVVEANFSGERYLLESFIDITDRKQAEEKLIESEEKFHLIFKNSNDAIYLFEITPSGMPGRIVDANEVALLQTALSKDSLLKMSFLDIHSSELPRKSRSIMMELLTKGHVRFEADVARHDGTKLPVEVSAQFAKLNQKTYVIAISRDVSRRKREERALRIANQKLQLMNIVAWHDIQNKVTGLRGYVELSKDLVTDDQMKKFIQSEEEVLKVIHQQLQYTKEYQEMGVHPQEWVNISQTLRMVLSLAELGAIQVVIGVADLEVFCDPVIAKVFSHLLDNTKIHGKKATSIHISCRETGDGLILIYEDDGVGIPEEQKKELFLRNVGTTTGFSLFFIHDLLEVSEMTIREAGIFGAGVRFEIGIPRGIYRFGHKSI